MSTTTQETPAVEEKVGIGAYLSLILGCYKRSYYG